MADDLLSALTSNETLDEDAVLHINPEDRTIRIPKDFVFGVYNDKDVLVVPFTIPRYYGENDLSDFTFTINYINAAGLGNIYDVVDLTVGEDRIDFTWTLGRAVFVTKGAVRFVVCIRKIGSNGRIEKELNTRIYVAEVLAGLEVDDNPDPEAYSILANMTELEASTKRLHDFVSNKASEIANITGEATRTLNEANEKLDEANEGIERVEEMFGSPLAASTVASMTDQTRVYVYTGSETGYTAGNWYYYNGSAWTSGGVYNSQGINTDTTLTVSGMAADAKTTGDEITHVKQDISELPNIYNTSAEDADLDITDQDGNVILRLEDGHIKTKNFDSEDVQLKQNSPEMKNSTANGDLDITDQAGNVIVRFSDGGLLTKKYSLQSMNDILVDTVFSIDNRLANPIYETLEHYNEEHSSAQIEVVEALKMNLVTQDNAQYRIPVLCITDDGTYLVAGTHMLNPSGDYGDFSIDLARKTTSGNWTASEVVPFDSSRSDYGSVLNNEFLVDRTNDRIYLFYGTEKQKVNWWEVTTSDGDFRYIYSDDDGANWSEPVSLKNLWNTDIYDYCIPSCTKGITLTNGTFVIPCFCKKGTTASTAKSYPLLLIKQPSGNWYFSSVASVEGINHLDECAVVEGTTANDIWLYCRPNTNYGTGVNRGYNKFRYNIATDTFEHLPCTFDGNRHNCFSIDRITINSTLIYLMSFTDTHGNDRENITLWASLDGDIWIRVYRINKSKSNGYSVLDNHSGVIGVAYEAKRDDTVHSNAIDFQDISALSTLIYDSATKYIVRNISVQDRMQMLFNSAKDID